MRQGRFSAAGRRSLRQIGICAALLATAAGLLHVLDRERPVEARVEQLAYLPKGEYLKLAVLGYRQVVADLIWLQAVQHIGAKRDTQQGYRWSYHALDVLTDLDPTFVPPYQAGGLFLGVLVGRHEEGMSLLRKGFAQNPGVWQLPFLIGYIAYYERCNAVEGGRYLQLAAQVPGAPAYLPKLAARMTVESGDPAAAAEFLDRFSRTVSDERVREALLQRMKEVVHEKDLLFLDGAVARYRLKYGQNPMKLDDLVLRGIIAQLPTDPLGGQYRLDVLSGRVGSSLQRDALRIHEKVACRSNAGDIAQSRFMPAL